MNKDVKDIRLLMASLANLRQKQQQNRGYVMVAVVATAVALMGLTQCLCDCHPARASWRQFKSG
jgi:hypothetical protein